MTDPSASEELMVESAEDATESATGKEEESTNAEKTKNATTFFGCLVALVLGTIAFDYVKESIIESVEESQLATVVDAMFGELTVLGFIGLFTFVMEKLKVFTWISSQVFDGEITEAHGEEAKEEFKKKVPEVFENLHMLLFLVMVIFICEVMLMIYYAKMFQRRWEFAEKICQAPKMLAAVMKGWHPRDHTITEEATEAMKEADMDPDQLDFFMDYLSLRVEFICPRDKDRTRLGPDFDFADYMGHVMGIVLAGIVNVSVFEWLALLAVFTGFYFVLLIVHSDMNVIAWVLLAFVYTIAGMMFALDQKLRWVMKQLTSRPKARKYLENQLAIMEESIKKNEQAHMNKTPRTPKDDETSKDETSKDEATSSASGSGSGAGAGSPEEAAGEEEAAEEAPAEEAATAEAAAAPEAEKPVADESTPLVSTPSTPRQDIPQDELPPFLKAEPVTERACLSEAFLGQLPNKHEQLFWFDRMGPRYNRMFIQVVMVMMAIYVPIQFHYLSKFVVEMEDHQMNWVFFVVYLVAIIVPIVFIYFEIMEVLSVQFLVCNVEMMRRRELIQKCKMNQRTAKVVRILQIINRLRQKAEVLHTAHEATKTDPEAQDAEIDPKRRRELEDIFDYFDEDGNGALDTSELAMFLASLGQPGNLKELAEALVDALDDDGNGTVEKDEFVMWMVKSEQHKTEAESIPEIAHKMFGLFDRDGDGFMTQDEFAQKMEGFGIKLTEEELALLMRELDEDGTGRIDENDFKLMLERHDFEA